MGEKLISDMTPEEQLALIDSFFSVEEGLQDAIALLEARKVNFDTDEGELLRIRIALAEAEAALSHVRARRRAFRAGALAMIPPPPEVFEAIGDSAAALDRMIARETTADSIMDAFALLTESFDGLQA